ncbi:MAG TPA: threonine--tRNA ligase [Gammaproteobacteria bacterium]|nr:threonine--tRNA ligase [Gammaproteobacteria bacterium]
MPKITLPDGAIKDFDKPISVGEVAASIGAGLAKAALAGKVNDKLVDLSYLINTDSSLSIITEKNPEGLEIIRHSCAHLLAQAVKSLFPSAQITIGPVIEDGFYYDIAYDRTFTPEDLEKLERKMTEISDSDLEVTRKELSRKEAITFFREQGEEYKAKIIEDIPETETLSIYTQGDFSDLCRGPHVPRTSKLKAFKLTKVAGAYWRGDAKNEMLQRIYGTAWTNKKDLDLYLKRLDEAEKRDHRKIGKTLDLFHIEESSPGMVFWHPDGWIIYKEIEQYLRKLLTEHDYQEIRTPVLLDKTLWEKSGHWEMFSKNMFISESENKAYAIKPMSCPAHIMIFKQGLKSYRDLPIRLAEFGHCHRNEPSGSLHGLMRVRGFVQDDAHIFCTEDQIQSESAKVLELLFKCYADFGFKPIVKFATRPKERIGSDAQWDKAEQALEKSLKDKSIPFELAPGEGAFYGPKLEFHLKDCIGRLWQCGTLQVDYSMPERLDAYYIAEDGSKQRPVMLHRAILGTLERFIAILIEHHAGEMPLWLSPTQVVLMNITDDQAEYAEKVALDLKKEGFRVKLDLRNEKIGFKIREHTLGRIPYQLIVGEKEKTQKTISVRTLKGQDLGGMIVSAVLDLLRQKIDEKCLSKEED